MPKIKPKKLLRSKRLLFLLLSIGDKALHNSLYLSYRSDLWLNKGREEYYEYSNNNNPANQPCPFLALEISEAGQSNRPHFIYHGRNDIRITGNLGNGDVVNKSFSDATEISVLPGFPLTLADAIIFADNLSRVNTAVTAEQIPALKQNAAINLSQFTVESEENIATTLAGRLKSRIEIYDPTIPAISVVSVAESSQAAAQRANSVGADYGKTPVAIYGEGDGPAIQLVRTGDAGNYQYYVQLPKAQLEYFKTVAHAADNTMEMDINANEANTFNCWRSCSKLN